jgi:hypothetical protein
MSDPGESDEYYRAIEEEFCRLRGALMLLSPRDWALISEWRTARIPLRVALQGITNVFDSFAHRTPTTRRINSLSYCRQEVLSLHELYLGLHGVDAGRPATVAGKQAPASAVLRHLTRLGRHVREAMTLASEKHDDRIVQALARVTSDLKRMRREVRTATLEPQALEEQLRQLDETLLEVARESLSPDERARLEAEADAMLGDRRARMTEQAFAVTLATYMARHLRLSRSLPRLTLFD